MPHVDALSHTEQSAIEELKNRVKDVLTSPVLGEDVTLYYRFLKARDFNVDKAETFLLEHINWRKVYQVDNILESFNPKEVFVKCIEPSFVGFDKEADIVRYFKCGTLNTSELMKCIKMQNYTRNWIWYAEKNASLIKMQAKKTGKMISVTYIMDLDGLEFSNATSKMTMDLLLNFVHLLQDNYPERMKSIYVINAPSFYVLVYTIVKAIMSRALIRKIHVYGESGWKEKLLEVIDADVLPVFLGGKRTDPDGDPYCRSFINIPMKVSQNYYLSEEERYFESSIATNTLVIHPSKKKELFVNIEEVGSLIQWKFIVKSKTIHFGLFFQESQEVVKEIIPMHEYDTSDGTEENSYKCFSKGKYVLVFDNSSSWYTTKTVKYTISVKKPEV